MDHAEAFTPTAPPSAALQKCFDEVADSAPMALGRCLDQVVSVLQQAEGTSVRSAERTELGDAWRELQQHRAAWCERYPDELRAAFKAARAPKPASPAVDTTGNHSARVSELSLVDDAQIVEAIESSRLVQQVMPLVERPISELDALVSSTMGLGGVRPELNPVRPEVFAQTLRAMISRTQVKAATGSLWMKYMAEPLGHELQDLYGKLVIQLKEAHVQAAEYRWTPASAAAPSRAAAAGDAWAGNLQAESSTARATTGAPTVRYGALSGRQIGHALLREFLLNGGGEQASQMLPASYYTEVEREIVRLKSQTAEQRDDASPPALPAGYRDLPPVDRPQRTVGIGSTLNRQVWGDYAQSHERSVVRTQLRKDARRVAQVLGLELVRKVVNQVAQDPRLLAPVREAIVALEPSLLRLAMVDPRFFSEEHHPGRRLMERVAQRSFKYNDEFGTEFAGFFEGMSRCFNALNHAAVPDAQPFEEALAQLEAAWSAQDQLDKDSREHAVKAMRFAEQRQLEADQIAWELSSRPDLESVPSVVQDFLFGPWALVLAHARLTDSRHEIDPNGYLSVISDLLWSVKPEVTLRQPAQLFERVPRLVAALRAGLASLGQLPEDNEPFFQALMKLHRPVLKLRRAKSRRDARESGVAPLAAVDLVAEPAAARQAKVAEGQPWMSPQELNAAGFEETLPTDMAQLYAEAGDSAPAPLEAPASVAATLVREEPPAQKAPARTPPAAAAEVDTILANLREGNWVDLYAKGRWRRAQLIWASSKNTLFMFVSHGGQPHSMTKRICERLVRDRYLRPVRTYGVVARALTVLDEEDPSP
jgi:hypothetical protein